MSTKMDTAAEAARLRTQTVALDAALDLQLKDAQRAVDAANAAAIVAQRARLEAISIAEAAGWSRSRAARSLGLSHQRVAQIVEAAAKEAA